MIKLDRYDPLVEPPPKEWLALDEDERIILVEDYHRRERIRLPRARRALHAQMHVVIENQIAGDKPPITRSTVERLQTEGLDRHDAIHAVAAIQITLISDMVGEEQPFAEDEYVRRLENLSGENWRRDEWY